MKRLLAEIFGSGPWQYNSRVGRVMIAACILTGAIAWIALGVRLL